MHVDDWKYARPQDDLMTSIKLPCVQNPRQDHTLTSLITTWTTSKIENNCDKAESHISMYLTQKGIICDMIVDMAAKSKKKRKL